MDLNDKKQFGTMLIKLMAAYGKALPEGPLLDAWWDELNPYPLQVVAMALRTYRDEQPTFAPTPNAIRVACQTCDGRPGTEEAWAIALTGRDEADTVVWTQETAEAFAIAGPVLEMGDEVGARMAFKEAYQRLVAAARNRGVPAQWLASLGWDVERRTAALTKASNAGLLAAPVVAGLLPPPAAGALDNDPNARSQLDKIRQMMATMNAEKSREAELHAQRERDATAEAKRLANEKVALYQVGKAA